MCSRFMCLGIGMGGWWWVLVVWMVLRGFWEVLRAGWGDGIGHLYGKMGGRSGGCTSVLQVQIRECGGGGGEYYWNRGVSLRESVALW